MMYKTSTWTKGTSRQILGEAGEIVVQKRLRQRIEQLGAEIDVLMQSELDDYGTLSSAEVAMSNSKNGDLFVIQAGEVTHGIEVKTSMDHPNASITESELLHSEARYLVAITTAGIWACTMDEVRRKSREVQTGTSSFWLVPFDRVEKVELSEVLL